MLHTFTLIYGVRINDGDVFEAREVAGTFGKDGREAAERQALAEMEAWEGESRADDDAFIILRRHNRTDTWVHVWETYDNATAPIDGLAALGYKLR